MKKPLRVTAGPLQLGDGLPCLLVAEIGLNHNGSMELAHRHLEAAALSGAAMVKFQKRSPGDLATAEFLDAPFLKCPFFGQTQRQVRERLELSRDQLRELKDHAQELGLLFSVTAFDLPSLEVCLELDLPLLKIASHSVTNLPLLEAVAGSGRPVCLSLGASHWEERDAAVQILRSNPLILLHCISAYPCPDHLVKLDTIPALRERYGCPVGYSGHETGIDLSLAAAALGACLIERHFTLNRAMVGLDHGLSLEPQEFARLALAVRRIERARGVSQGISPEEQASRQNYHVAICARRPLEAGHVLRPEDLVCKQPLGPEGVHFSGLYWRQLPGRRLTRPVAADQPIPRAAVEGGEG